jgi:lipoprotein-releasing system permease protein
LRQVWQVHRFVGLFIALRYLRPKRNFVSVITVLSLLGVLLGVSVLMLVLAVMDGFEKELRDKVVGFNAHVTVTNFGVMNDWQEVGELIKKQPGVVATSPFMTGPVLARIHNQISTPFIRGVDTATINSVIPINHAIQGGELVLTPDSVVVGFDWAMRYHAQLGDKVIVISPRNITDLMESTQPGKAKNAYLPSEYTISGFFTTGFYEYDSNVILVRLTEGQRLYDLGMGVHGILVRTQDPLQAFKLKDELNAKLTPPLQALTWVDQNKSLFGAVAVERRVMAFILFFIIVVAALGLCSTLITVTVQKAREIGLMKALGASDGQIVSIFTLYGLIIGVLGSALGVALGYLILSYRNEFSLWLSNTFHVDVFPPEIYHFAQIPAVADGWMIFWIALSGIALSTAAALFPAFAALRVDPATTLHAE